MMKTMLWAKIIHSTQKCKHVKPNVNSHEETFNFMDIDELSKDDSEEPIKQKVVSTNFGL